MVLNWHVPGCFFLSLSSELQRSVELSPELCRRSQESRGLYPLLAFSLKLELKNRQYRLKESSRPDAVLNVAMSGASASSSWHGNL